MLGDGGCKTCDTQRDKAYHREISRRLNRFFEDHPCTVCGETDPVLLDFYNGNHIWTMIENVDRPIDINRELNRSTVMCVSCIRRKITEDVGPWGIPKAKA